MNLTNLMNLRHFPVSAASIAPFKNGKGNAPGMGLPEVSVPVQRIAHSAIPQHFGFVQTPQPDAT